MEALLGYGKIALIVLEVVIIFNLLIVVHELGHFLAARWRGLVVEKFGIWFGKPLWKKKINGVEYSLGSIPAGGFVALPQMAPMEALEGESATDKASLPPVAPIDKIIVAFAGPLFSFLLALFFATLVWIVGKPVKQSESNLVIGYVEPDSNAAKAGLQRGDRIISVDNRPVTMFQAMSDSVLWNVVSSEGPTIPVKVIRDGKELTVEVVPTRNEQKGFGRSAKRLIAIDSSAIPMIAQVKPGSDAEKAGFQAGDLVVAIDGTPLLHINDIAVAQDAKAGQPLVLTVERKGQQRLNLTLPPSPLRIRSVSKGAPAEAAGLLANDVVLTADGRPATTYGFRRLAKDKVNHPIELSVQRGAETKTISVTPLFEENNKLPMIGILWVSDISWDDYGIQTIHHPTPWSQVVESVRIMRNTFAALLSPKSELGFRDLGGPVTIGRTYFHLLTSDEGWRRALWFSVFMNVNLALLNLLPIPVLDGGHITLALIEMVRRKPVSMRVLEVVQTACAVLIIGFMLYVTMFDVLDLPFLKRNRAPEDLKFRPAEVIDAKTGG